jgi:hypothetical protein
MCVLQTWLRPELAFIHSVVLLAPACTIFGTLICSVMLSMLGNLISPYKHERLMAIYATMYQATGQCLLA